MLHVNLIMIIKSISVGYSSKLYRILKKRMIIQILKTIFLEKNNHKSLAYITKSM